MILSEGTHKGYHWEVKRNLWGYKLGYVFIKDKNHPWWDKNKHQIEGVNIHGGITFSKKMININTFEVFWVVGFDCGHKKDLPDPGFEIENSTVKQIGLFNSIINNLFEENCLKPAVRSLEYVENECKSLCEQADLILQRNN